jgi:ribonuclease-3
MDPADWIESRLGYRFRDAGLLALSLTHRSASVDNNERLEFLGDAVLGAVIAHELLDRRPGEGEGVLSRIRARLVRRETLAELATSVDLGSRIRLGAGEARTGGHQRTSTLANALEAVLGAIYLDGGLASVRATIVALYGARLDQLPAADELIDPKTRLQEWLQARGMAPPVYAVTGVRGAAHAQTFTVSCDIGSLGLQLTGSGSSRRNAEQAAAAEALLRVGADGRSGTAA